MSEDSNRQADAIPDDRMLMVRRLLVQGIDEAWDEWLVQYVLGGTRDEATLLIQELASRGYIERATPQREGLWRCSIPGQVLAQVARIKPMPRDAAERKIPELVAKIETVRDDPRYLYKVTRAVVFGQFVAGAGAIERLDVAVSLKLKGGLVGQPSRTGSGGTSAEQRQAAGCSPARARELTRPQEDVLNFLESRSRIVEVTRLEEANLSRGRVIIYEEKRAGRA